MSERSRLVISIHSAPFLFSPLVRIGPPGRSGKHPLGGASASSHPRIRKRGQARPNPLPASPDRMMAARSAVPVSSIAFRRSARRSVAQRALTTRVVAVTRTGPGTFNVRLDKEKRRVRTDEGEGRPGLTHSPAPLATADSVHPAPSPARARLQSGAPGERPRWRDKRPRMTWRAINFFFTKI